MCVYCSMIHYNRNKVETWAKDGCAKVKLQVISRATAQTHPNTFVFVFKEAIVFAGTKRDVFVDAHYEGDKIEAGKTLIALGGLWVKGIKDQDMKPTQHGGKLLEELLAAIPANAPDPTTVDATWGAN